MVISFPVQVATPEGDQTVQYLPVPTEELAVIRPLQRHYLASVGLNYTIYRRLVCGQTILDEGFVMDPYFGV
jgi:hypothetical protein